MKTQKYDNEIKNFPTSMVVKRLEKGSAFQLDPISSVVSPLLKNENSFHTTCVPRGTEEEKEVFGSVATLGEMEAGPPEPPCRGRL